MPRPSGRLQRTNDDHRSCSSPPPTNTAPTSVSSQASPPSPLVSVSTTRNSAVAVACSRSVTDRVIRLGADGKQAGLQLGPRSRKPPPRSQIDTRGQLG